VEARQLLEQESKRSIQDRSFVRAVSKKWEKMLEGISDPYTRGVTAILLENEVNHLYQLKESTTTGSFADFIKFVFPMIRRVWPNLIGNRLASIQPMTGPIGGIFTWEYKYGTTKGTITAGDNMIENFDRFYSSEYIYNELIGTGDGLTANYTGTLTWLPVKPYQACPNAQVVLEFISTDISDNDMRIYDAAGASGASPLTGDVGAASTITFATGDYDITFNANVKNQEPVYANYYYDMEAATNTVPQINLDISLESIKANSRKLRMLWSAEATDDLRAIHGMDAEGELVAGVASEVALEIDRELIMDMYAGAVASGNSAVFDADPGTVNPVDHYRNILTPCTKVSQEIGKRTLRGPGNWMVTSPQASVLFAALEAHGDFKSLFSPGPGPAGQGTLGQAAPTPPQGPEGFGVFTMGVLQNRWTVYIDPLFPNDKILVGLKGRTFLDAGMVYAPYVPLQVTSTVLDPDDMQFRKGMRTRYAKKLTNNNFYGIINLQNLP